MRKILSVGLVAALALVLTGAFFFAGVALAQSRGSVAVPTPMSPGAYINPNPGNTGGDPWGWGSRSGMRWGGPGMMNGCCGNGSWREDWGGWGMGSMRMGMMPMHGYWGRSTAITSTVPAPTTTSVSFQKDIQPIFEARCVACHGGARGLYLTDYDSVLRGSTNGPVILPGDPVGSRLIQYVASGYMPYGGPSLTQAQIQTLVNWVAAGAPNN